MCGSFIKEANAKKVLFHNLALHKDFKASLRQNSEASACFVPQVILLYFFTYYICKSMGGVNGKDVEAHFIMRLVISD